VLQHKWKTFGRWTHLVFTIFPYLALLAAYLAAYQLRVAEIRAAAPDPDDVTCRFQVRTHPPKSLAVACKPDHGSWQFYKADQLV
jgi:hypothetical protein